MNEGDSYYQSFSNWQEQGLVEYGGNIIHRKKTNKKNKDDYQGKHDFQEQQQLI